MKKLPILLSLAVLFTTAHAQTPEATLTPEATKPPEVSNSAVVPAHKLAFKGWRERHEQIIKKVKAGDPQLILIGDSFIHGLDGQKALVFYYH